MPNPGDPQELLPVPLARRPDVVFVATPEHMIDVVLSTAQVTSRDVVYDLGCGDGRLVIAAAARRGAHGVGIDIDPDRIAEARANALRAEVGDLVTFVEADMFEVDLAGATVVTLYLLPSVNLRLRPKLERELGAGARIVSLGFDMGSWPPADSVDVSGRVVHMWTMPAGA